MKMETLTAEKKLIQKATVTLETAKDHQVLAEFLELKCNLATKKSPNRPWLYLKSADTLKTIGGIRLNKNSIGTFYIDTNISHPLSDVLFGVVSKESKNFVSNRIIVNDLKTLEKVCDLINELMADGRVYTGTRN